MSVLSLETIVSDFADALRCVDAKGPVCKEFLPGIGPFGEKEAVQLAFQEMRKARPGSYDDARRLPGCNSATDIVIGCDWALEIKVARPYGNNGLLAEHWITNLLYPYKGNYSLLGDGMKLRDSGFSGRKAPIVYGFEHPTPETDLSTAINAFETIASKIVGLQLSERHERQLDGLVHPIHSRLMYGLRFSNRRSC
jgi:hypothetical protein